MCDILADVQSGKINANDFLNQVEVVLIESIDKPLEDSTNKLANVAEIVGGYHKTWPGKPRRPFSSYTISQVNRDLIELPEDEDGIYRSLVNGVSALHDKPEHEDRVSLLSGEKLLGNLTEYYARSARARLVQEQAKKVQQEIYERVAPRLVCSMLPPSSKPPHSLMNPGPGISVCLANQKHPVRRVFFFSIHNQSCTLAK